MMFHNTNSRAMMRIWGCTASHRFLPPCLLQMLEAELLYRQCASDARIHQEELVKVKEKIISHMRKLICQGDNVLKEVGVESRKLNIWPFASSIYTWYINRGCVVGME